MIDRKSRRVVILNNIQSETIDQAIFILKTNHGDKKTEKSDVNIANEAQCIINNYIRQVERFRDSTQNTTKPGRKFPGWLKFLLTTALFSVAVYLIFQIS